jgi:hypothetical protein
MTTPQFGIAATGSGEVRDQDGNLVNQEENNEQETN